MQKQLPKSPFFHRDGTSQAGRLQAALDPDYVSVDERSVKDLLAFAQEYAKELRYYNAKNQEEGDWSAFFRPDVNLDQVVAFMNQPERFQGEGTSPYRRPHFVLFLTFLQLLRHTQQQLNTLTKRHLDFYYQQVLRMSKKTARPDHVNALVELAGDVDQVLLPAGTLLNAGTDSLGQDLFYQTDRNIVVNHAQVERVSSVYADKQVTGIREARDMHPGQKNEKFIKMLEIALGDPKPGDPLPTYPRGKANGKEVNNKLLEGLSDLVSDVKTDFKLSFSEFRELMRLKTQRDEADDEWNKINRLLEKAGQTQTDDSSYKLDPASLRDFDANLKKALDDPDDFDHLFDGITEVEDIYDAYDKRIREDVQNRILERLYLDMPDFTAMMQIKVRVDYEWAEINRLLEKAGQTRWDDPDYQLNPEDPTDFDANLRAVLAPNYTSLPDVGNIDEHYTAFLYVQRSFFMSAENFASIMSVAKESEATPEEWDKVYTILADAHKAKVYTDRRDRLKQLREEQGFAAMIDFAVGDEGAQTELTPLQRIKEYISKDEDAAFLNQISQREVTETEWDRVYRIVEFAQRVQLSETVAKKETDRRDRLKQLREEQGFAAMIAFAVGDKGTQKELTALEILKKNISKDEDAAFLNQISQREVTETEWDRVYDIVELVQRVRLPEPVAQKEKWLNLYPEEDAKAVSVTLGIEGDEGHSRWKTFGQGQPSVSKEKPPPASFGWAISSPLLALSQGTRTITLTLGFQPDPFDGKAITSLSKNPDTQPFRIEISTEKGWIEPDTVTVKPVDYPGDNEKTLQALQFHLTFAENIDAITPLPAEEAQIDTPWPVLRLMLRQIGPLDDAKTKGRYITHYQPFKELVLVRTHVKVAVSGLTPLQIQNDETVLDAQKPFEPFGTSPSVGSRFYLGHPELVYQKLDCLDLNLEWMGVPADLLTDHYENYDNDAITFANNFTVRISLIDRRVDLELNKKASLFATSFKITEPFSAKLQSANVPNDVLEKFKSIENQKITGKKEFLALKEKIKNAGAEKYQSLILKHILSNHHITISLSDISAERTIESVFNENLLTWDRYLQWELNPPDFQHEAYPTIAAKKSIELAVAMAKPDAINAEDYQVNPPYTPKIKKLSLDYTASVEIRMAEYKPGSQIDRMFHIQPFGYNEIQPDSPSQRYLFLPQYNNEGELYIGIRDVHPPQNLSLLFQMAEGSANPDLEPVPVQWSYLSGNRWMSLTDGNVLRDTTRGLINSGIIEFDLEPTQPNTLLPPELYWIRATIARHSNSVCDTVAIHAQAVSATFDDHDNAPDHLSRPLPAGSITALAEPQPEVTGIRQPYTSYGGKMAEQDSTFYTRISERLRHKHRALTMWDYEHMILEQFPQIYKAKCLPVGLTKQPEDPGRVEIVVIPDIKNKRPFNPFEPKAPSDLLLDIETYLKDKIPTFATVKVKNAHYVQVKVRFAVRFLPGYNEGYYKQRLNKDLNRFLSPWAYEEGADIVIGGKIYASSIVNFLDRRPYVDFIAAIKLFSSDDGRTSRLAQPSDSEGYFVTTDRLDGVLVAARRHEIDIISEVGYEHEIFTGINYMKIELDFIVAEPEASLQTA